MKRDPLPESHYLKSLDDSFSIYHHKPQRILTVGSSPNAGMGLCKPPPPFLRQWWPSILQFNMSTDTKPEVCGKCVCGLSNILLWHPRPPLLYTTPICSNITTPHWTLTLALLLTVPHSSSTERAPVPNALGDFICCSVCLLMPDT